MKYKVLEHKADLKIQAFGKNLPELFSNILEGMFRSCQPEISGKKKCVRKVQIKSQNLESLLVDFLSEALYLSDINNEVYFKAKFDLLNERELSAKLEGYKMESSVFEIKAVTWHNLEIKKQKHQWQATVLFDV